MGCHLEKIVISRAYAMKGLDKLFNRSTNLQYLEVENCDRFLSEGKMNVRHLTLKNAISASFSRQLMLACKDTLEVVDITMPLSFVSFIQMEWFLPKVKKMYVRGDFAYESYVC